MPSYRTHRVAGVLAERRGLQRVELDDGSRAYVLSELTGPVAAGDDVVVNTTAVELGLGTGGWHVVHWNLTRRSWEQRGPGHIMKLRYTSLQTDTGAAEEHHPDLPGTLDGVPIVACSLHSQVGVVALTIHHLDPTLRVSYVMTDGAALPLALSDLVHELRHEGVLSATVTAGHAFGGDLEAVALPSALLLARHVQAADVIVAGMGPGVVGTASRHGTTAVEVAGILDTTAALGGVPICCVRASSADERPRHRGTSHHTTTALDLCRTAGVVVPAPAGEPLQRATVSVHVPDVGAVLGGRRLTTMGRDHVADPLFFTAAMAAGAVATDHVDR